MHFDYLLFPINKSKLAFALSVAFSVNSYFPCSLILYHSLLLFQYTLSLLEVIVFPPFYFRITHFFINFNANSFWISLPYTLAKHSAIISTPCACATEYSERQSFKYSNKYAFLLIPVISYAIDKVERPVKNGVSFNIDTSGTTNLLSFFSIDTAHYYQIHDINCF